MSLMFVDFHSHIFTPQIFDNIERKATVAKALNLRVAEARLRMKPSHLEQSLKDNGFLFCVTLPSASADKARKINDRFYEISQRYARILTFATLHPEMNDYESEVQRTLERGIRGFKFSSFSQKFDLLSPESSKMLAIIQKYAKRMGIVPTVVFDTFCKADKGFGAEPNHLTTPDRLSEVYPAYPGINFVGAHMGGLMADFDDLKKHLQPASNFYLDTSNAAHTLERAQFVELLKIHGSSNILFGTDWPWFTHSEEIAIVDSLLRDAGFSETDRENVFRNNALRLLKMA